MWPDTLMRIIPMAVIPFLYIAVLHLPLSFLGLIWGNVPEQLFIGLLIGIFMAAFAVVYRMFIVGPWFRRPTVGDHFLQGFFYLFINAPIEELFFRGFVWGAVTQWTGWIGWGWLVSTAAYTLYHRLGNMGIDILPSAEAGGFTPRRDNGMASPESLPICIQTVSTYKV